MKKELSIRLSLLGRVKLFVAGWADAYANLFSLYLGEKVSTGHVMRITHAVVAFMVLVFSYCSNPLLSMLFLIWFVLTLLDCKKVGCSLKFSGGNVPLHLFFSYVCGKHKNAKPC